MVGTADRLESSTVLRDLDADGLLTLTLNRPERHNAWNLEMEVTLHDLLENASADPKVRVVLLTGAGRSFCPGLDSADLDRASQPGQSIGHPARRPVVLPALVPKPVVCAINGACAGLGLITALASDVRFAAEEAKITTAFARRGLPAEQAISWLLPRIVGHALALDLLLSSRVVLGSEAARLGLVHQSVPAAELLPAARAYAREMATNCSPFAMATAKRQVYRDWERNMADSYADAVQLVGVLRDETPDFREGVRSFVEKRPARFAPFWTPIDKEEFPGYEGTNLND
jgi:enoyl-CoA hydratase/carnithine racemase